MFKKFIRDSSSLWNSPKDCGVCNHRWCSAPPLSKMLSCNLCMMWRRFFCPLSALFCLFRVALTLKPDQSPWQRNMARPCTAHLLVHSKAVPSLSDLKRGEKENEKMKLQCCCFWVSLCTIKTSFIASMSYIFLKKAIFDPNLDVYNSVTCALLSI